MSLKFLQKRVTCTSLPNFLAAVPFTLNINSCHECDNCIANDEIHSFDWFFGFLELGNVPNN